MIDIKKIIDLIEPMRGGSDELVVMQQQNENKIESKIDNNNNYVDNIIKRLMEDFNYVADLSKILNDFGSNPDAYMMFKNHIKEYKRIFGNKFDEIHEILKKINKFGQEDRDSMDPSCVNMLYETVVSFSEYKDIMDALDDDDKNYLAVIKKIYTEKDQKIFDVNCGIFYRVLYNFDSFNFTKDNTIKEIQDRLVYLYNKPDSSDEDEDEYDEDDSDNEYKKKYLDYKLGLIKLTNEQIEELEENMLMNDSKIRRALKETEDEDDEDETDENEEENKNETKGGVSSMVDVFQKYLKYKLKYIDLKKEIEANKDIK